MDSNHYAENKKIYFYNLHKGNMKKTDILIEFIIPIF